MARPVRKLRILVLMHAEFVPPESLKGYSDTEIDRFKTEYDVVGALEELGHEVRPLGVKEELRPIRTAIEEWQPDIAFNLLEEFRGEAHFDQHVVAYLELMRVPYTGCNPRGLVISRDKALTKKIATYHRVRVPRFAVFRQGQRVRRSKRLAYPLIVKSLVEEASLGISKASVVRDDEALRQRVEFVHQQIRTEAIAEQFIPGRELYVGVLGNDRLRAFPPRELVVKRRLPDEELIATERVKHNVKYQKERGVEIVPPHELQEGIERQLERLSKRIYRALYLDGYARIDYRLSEGGELYLLEANPNPEIARFEEFASCAEDAGYSYEGLLQRILNLGLRRSASPLS